MVEIESHLDSNQTREPGKFANPLRCVKRVFYLGGESCLGGLPNLGYFYSIFGGLLDGFYTIYYAPPMSRNAMTLKDLLLTTREVWT